MHRCSLLAALLISSGCFGSHGRSGGVDGGPAPDADAGCRGSSSLECYFTCLDHVARPPICEDGEWACEPGTFPDSVCRGRCPEPLGMCTREGATCETPAAECAPSVSCRCSGGEWECDSAPGDPSCPHIDECDVLFERDFEGEACEFNPLCSRIVDGVECCTRNIECIEGTLQNQIFCFDSCPQSCEFIRLESDCRAFGFGCEWTLDGCR